MMESYFKTENGSSDQNQCLSDLQIAVLLDNSLKVVEKQALIKHLNRCESCRFCWMEASVHINSYVPSLNKRSWFDSLGKLIPKVLIPKKIPAAIAVMAAVVLYAVLIFPMQQGVESLLDQQYVHLTDQQHSLQAQQAMDKMALPWEQARLGFTPAYIDTTKLIFAAGLLEGRNALSFGTNEPLPVPLTIQLHKKRGADQVIFYQLGRWMATLWFASKLGQTVDWSQHAVILQQFKHDLRRKNKPDSQANRALKILQPIDIALQAVQQDPYARDDLRHQVEIAMIQLSPESLGE